MKSLFFLLLLQASLLYGQSFTEGDSIPLVADTFLGVDGYKNLYFTKDMVLHKTGEDGNYNFNDFQLGEITSVDLINPLNIVVFYEMTNTVVLLDNRLNEIERINFNNVPEFTNVGAANNAGNNRLWLFNIDTQQLELFNYRTQRKTIVSQPFPGQLLGLASNFNYCFLLTERKLRSFNVYGSLLKELPNDSYTHVFQQDEKVFVLKGRKLLHIPDMAEEKEDSVTIQPFEVPIKENQAFDLYLTQEILYLYDGTKLRTFTRNQPKKE
ncbi:hypothetical protein MG296_02165 [Flavobacteriaceae bacterium TK19130]|nr:hypothetical protein [Thermobacterium salinum]